MMSGFKWVIEGFMGWPWVGFEAAIWSVRVELQFAWLLSNTPVNYPLEVDILLIDAAVLFIYTIHVLI
jgi:hypothetical protein